MSPALAADGWAGKVASRRQVGSTVLNPLPVTTFKIKALSYNP